MNRQKGNMYKFVTHTWNPIRGKCPHECSYCYMKGFKVGELRLVEKALNENLGSGNFIFVGSSVDMFANKVNGKWIELVIERCLIYPNNKYLFQSKNPARFKDFFYFFYGYDNVILGTTIETNKPTKDISKAKHTYYRYVAMKEISNKKMISIEPIIDFDLEPMLLWLKEIKPEFVSIGADSKNSKLKEPSKEKVLNLINKLKPITHIICKNNLKRLLK